MADLRDLITINEKEKTLMFSLASLAPLVGSLVRHAAAAAGAILVTKGLAEQESVNQVASGLGDIAGGAAIYVLSQALSFVKVKKNKK